MYNKRKEIFSRSLVSTAEGTPAFLVREGHSTAVVRRGHVPNADSVAIDRVYKDSKISTVHVLLERFYNTA